MANSAAFRRIQDMAMGGSGGGNYGGGVQTTRNTNYTGEVQDVGGRKTQLNSLGQRVFTDNGFLVPPGKEETIEGAAQTAMEETQRRAEEDRKLALAGVTEREIKALDAISGGREQALEAIASGSASAIEAIHAATEQGISQYEATERLLAEAEKEISPEREAEMYEAGRVGVEAGTQASKKRIQESYARGGAPGSAAMRMMGDIESAGQGDRKSIV